MAQHRRIFCIFKMSLFFNEFLYVYGEKLYVISSNYDCSGKTCFFYEFTECKRIIKEFNCCGKLIIGFKQCNDF